MTELEHSKKGRRPLPKTPRLAEKAKPAATGWSPAAWKSRKDK